MSSKSNLLVCNCGWTTDSVVILICPECGADLGRKQYRLVGRDPFIKDILPPKRMPGEINAIALDNIERNNMLVATGFDCKTGLPIVRKWELKK